MADVTDVKSVTDLLSKVTDGFKDFFTNLEGTLEKLAGIPNILTGADNSLKKVTSSSKDASDALDKTHDSALNLIDDFIKFGTDVGNTFSAMSKGSYESVDALGDVNVGVSTIISSIGLMAVGTNDAFSVLNDGSKIAASNLDSLGKNFNNLFNFIQNITGIDFPFSDKIKTFVPIALDAVNSTNNLETSLLALHASAGDLATSMTVINGTMGDAAYSQDSLNKLTDEYSNVIKRTVESTGASVNAVIGYTKEILAIPGLYNEIVSGGDDVNKNLSFTEAAMKATRGTTQDFGATLEIAKQQMLNFNSSGQSSLELLSRMYSVSQSLGTPFNFIQDQVKKVSDQFKFLGDNTEGALTIFKNVGDSLKNSGIGPKAISEIVGDVTDSIAHLDIAQKSFLSAQTGGAGGLQGGYQIEEMLANGKIDEVYKKMEGALRQEFGGKVTTRSEAATNAGDAQQYTKEVAFLTQGPFGAIVKNSEEAAKLLEGFKTGKTTAESTPSESGLQAGLDKSLNAGTDIQKAQYTELQKIANNTALFQLNSQRDVGQNIRNLTSTDLKTKANPTTYAQSIKDAPNTTKATLYAGSDIAAGVAGTFDKIINSGVFKAPSERIESPDNISTPIEQIAPQNNPITPTLAEQNVTRNNQNITPPQIQSPDIIAQNTRNNILRRQDDRKDTVPANFQGDQTVYVKVQITGLDGKTEERLVAKTTVKAIQDMQTYDQNSGTVGHQGNQ